MRVDVFNSLLERGDRPDRQDPVQKLGVVILGDGGDGLVLLAAQPAASMDVDEQGRGFLRLDLPEIELHVLVGTVGDMLVSRLDVLGNERRYRED